jgi:hypothetical protein
MSAAPATTSVFDALPGIEAPVGGISAAFRQLWAASPAEEMRAMQLNLVLHLGANTTPEDANEQFRATVRFSQRYPCRVVVLCPDFDEAAPAQIKAKIYGECFTGKAKNDTRCCEFVLLYYTMAVRRYLENQVSVCLSTDLPLYYWAHRFSATKRLADYSYLLTRSKRIMFDSAVVPADAFTYPWPNIAAVRDLAYTRTLPLRQNLGQFLSRYAPALISGGLRGVTIKYRANFAAEANCLLGWIKKGLVRSNADLAGVVFQAAAGDCPGCLALSFAYADPKKVFRWEANLDTDEARFEGDLGTGRTTLALGAHLLTPETALAEAMFF